ncbi:MAG: isochorismatase family protein [Synergistota bacterium]|jgi:nicotinamidase-related amidase|nr:isochorismatase family protein [Synergistota bacterium]OPZ37347.1 MAG: Isochorismatase family protein [Synergistetes bacterium ADurb.BinA166]
MSIFRLRRDSTQFLMIDVQQRLLPAISNSEEIHGNILKLARAADVLGVPFLYTEQYPRGLGPTDEVLLRALPEGSPRFEKTSFSCCDEEGFEAVLESRGKPDVALFGIETHICVLATVLDLLGRGTRVAVVADACGSRYAGNSSMALDAMRSAGALVLPTETAIYHLMGRSGTPEFKELLPLFKD